MVKLFLSDYSSIYSSLTADIGYPSLFVEPKDGWS